MKIEPDSGNQNQIKYGSLFFRKEAQRMTEYNDGQHRQNQQKTCLRGCEEPHKIEQGRQTVQDRNVFIFLFSYQQKEIIEKQESEKQKRQPV